jgi:hypothetical protein
MRPAELCGLGVRSVDFARHTIHVNETLLPVHKLRRPGVSGRPVGALVAAEKAGPSKSEN